MANRKYCPEIVALGGVSSSNLAILQKSGFDGAAMLGAIWQAEDPLLESRQALDIATNLTNG